MKKTIFLFLLLFCGIVFAQQRVYVISVHYSKGNFTLKSIVETTAYPQKSEEWSPTTYKAVILDVAGKVLYSHNFYVHTSEIVPPFPPEHTGGGVSGFVEVEETDFALILPYFENASRIDIYNPDGKLVLSVQVPSKKEKPIETAIEEKKADGYFFYLLFGAVIIFIVAILLLLVFLNKRKEGRNTEGLPQQF
ncbi:MAG: hypothetical protein QW400_01925 [Candidatus Diapherotrites archaeon]